MFRKLKKFITKESGQAMVIVAVSFVVLLGVTAFSVDLGMMASTKAKLQAAADAAALAGAQNLPTATTAMQKAKEYAVQNGAELIEVTAVTPYAGNIRKIQVTITQNFDYIFAKVLGFDSKQIIVRAVAEKQLVWGGETLPFMNIDDVPVAGENLVLWENNGTGDFEALFDNQQQSEYFFEYLYDDKGKPISAINCLLDGLGDGAIDLRNGLKFNIQPEVEQLIELWKSSDFVYVLSLQEIPADPVNYINAKSIKDGTKKDSATISLYEIVLLKCKIISYSSKPQDRGIVLQYLGESINLGDAIQNKTYIPGFANSTFRIKLVE